jgi:hypothetical protein
MRRSRGLGDVYKRQVQEGGIRLILPVVREGVQVRRFQRGTHTENMAHRPIRWRLRVEENAEIPLTQLELNLCPKLHDTVRR